MSGVWVSGFRVEFAGRVCSVFYTRRAFAGLRVLVKSLGFLIRVFRSGYP